MRADDAAAGASASLGAESLPRGARVRVRARRDRRDHAGRARHGDRAPGRGAGAAAGASSDDGDEDESRGRPDRDRRRRAPRTTPSADRGRPPSRVIDLRELRSLSARCRSRWARPVAVHAALLTVRFVDPEGFNRVFQDTPLEVILVNAASSEAPEKAQAIAQATLAGGGEADKGRATTPLPPSALTEIGDAAEDAQQADRAAAGAAALLLAQVRRELAALPPPDPQRDQRQPRSSARRKKAPPAGQAAGRDREAHQRRERAAQEALHQPGHARRGLCGVLRRAAPQDRGPRHAQLPREPAARSCTAS